MSENDNTLPAAKTEDQPVQGLSIEEFRQLRQFYVLHARKVFPMPAFYSDDKCLRVLRKHVKRLIRALGALSSVINQKTNDNEHFQREIIRNRRYIRQALKYYRHLLNDLENLKPQPENRKSSTCLKRLRDKLISIFTKSPGIYQNPEPKKERR